MDFFKSQDIARHNTKKLVFFFILAVVSIILFTNLLVMFAFGFVNTKTLVGQQFDWPIFLAVSVGVIALITMGSLYKVNSLSGGGARVAELMNGKLIVDSSGDPDKQRVLNVVEEMAIAAGLPVPPVYLLEEEAINAFAAGYSPSDAVIGVTRGAIKNFSRDELQGVIGHEFSHILNGDMRLNIRLIGLLHGILLIGLIGYYLLRFGPRSRNSKGGAGILFLGAGMVLVGYGGTFFGNLIKAAVSRQREYLADAAAVQFTRNPQGIGGALMHIGAHKKGAILKNPNSSEISHSLFCQGFSSSLTAFFATHPPLSHRIKKIIPSWDGEFVVRKPPASQTSKTDESHHQRRPTKKQMAIMAGGMAVLSKDKVVNQVGRPSQDHLEYAQQLIENLPPEFKQAAHDPYGARAIIYCLVLDNDRQEQQKQLNYLKSAADTGVYSLVIKLSDDMTKLKKEHRLPVVDIALPSLQQLSPEQYRLFKNNLQGLVAIDGKIDLFEWILQKIVFHHLDKVFEKKIRTRNKEPNIIRVKEACTMLLSLFAMALKQEGVSREQAFAAAKQEMSWLDTDLMSANSFKLKDLDSALDDLATLKPHFKASLIKACTAIITADKNISAKETELLRAVADTLECPIPPFLDFRD